jgi:hypothetical protein
MKGRFLGLGSILRQQPKKRPLMDDLQDDVLVLARFLHSIPGVEFWSGKSDTQGWWVKFGIDPSSGISWHIVLELGHILNSFALRDPLPTVFKPVAPPPQGNNAALEDLAWVIECRKTNFSPIECATVLRQWGPSPASDRKAWANFRRH